MRLGKEVELAQNLIIRRDSSPQSTLVNRFDWKARFLMEYLSLVGIPRKCTKHISAAYFAYNIDLTQTYYSFYDGTFQKHSQYAQPVAYLGYFVRPRSYKSNNESSTPSRPWHDSKRRCKSPPAICLSVTKSTSSAWLSRSWRASSLSVLRTLHGDPSGQQEPREVCHLYAAIWNDG